MSSRKMGSNEEGKGELVSEARAWFSEETTHHQTFGGRAKERARDCSAK